MYALAWPFCCEVGAGVRDLLGRGPVFLGGGGGEHFRWGGGGEFVAFWKGRSFRFGGEEVPTPGFNVSFVSQGTRRFNHDLTP